MAAALLPSLGLLHALAFLLRLSTASPSRGAPEPPPEHPAGCSPSPKACGGLNVSYPFWLEEPGRPPCGSPPFQLKCNASGAFLSHSVFQAYRVVAIFARNSSVHVVDENLPLATGCPAPCFNISLAAMGLGVFAISQANSELRFLSRCSEPVPEALPGFRRLPCDDNASFVGFGGRFGSSGRFHRATPPGCLVTVVPTLPAPAAPDGHGHGHDYVAGMRRGFLLEWTAVSGDCSKCIASGGECIYPDNGMGFSCNCPDGIHYPMTCGGGSKRTGRKAILIVLMAVGASLLLPCICVMAWYIKRQKLCFLFCKKTIRNNERNIEALISSHGSLAPKRYKYSEAMKITSSMNNKLGEGGYGVVFKGRLHDGRLVAVKFLHDSKAKGEEFVNEVMSIGRTSHVNIVSLYGFCLEGSKRALIYEYMPNGSLDKYIYSKNPKEILGWERLYAIAVGIARGLEYLHHSCNTRIVHFDIKPQNILLDHNFCPKIADFGLAKLCRTKESKLSVTGARGTIGFIAPEVHTRTFGVVSTKSDVYSYGMLLLEMVGGRKNVKTAVEKSSQNYFPDWIYDHFGQDDGLQACGVTQEVEEIAKKMSLIGLWCIQILPMQRPTIT
ncbi:LEAF RUST 10 DISEASE-RESISTANCE LOCUS RECEPTOR-LIKE PROTEIN KINASE-like 2.1 [Panicum virgatum]|uniref:Protein kinase domain-containing protein n=1 Tax=Panicum virgatum TaxID=38727 RepID=A0A8T0SC71_PANVG|nr:LEAF RUST 10 DISEASE-RESISTANCE LOCUS RECEPTOR-LIKE PROTEIN KINASE-like 2.1 [Panicum virgatum]KAG2595817.1 hypothetical protein PVAP13_5KG100400 [Panicum virgatum]